MGIFDGIGKSLLRSLTGKLSTSMMKPIMDLLKGGGLNDLIAKFKNKGLGDLISSWVGTGANKPVTKEQVRHALGDEHIGALAKETGLSEDQVLQHLQEHLPTAVDAVTPTGSVPTADELEKMLHIG